MQARAQAEIDQVVGRDRIPNAADEKNLPYTRAIIKVCGVVYYTGLFG
jgi:hypothetical protein